MNARVVAAAKVVVMGVAGSGKSSVARACADRLGWPMVEGDDFHAPASVEKMKRGIALTDADRQNWLERLRDLLHDTPAPIVLACSALRRSYREVLRQRSPDLRLVFLDIDQATALQRVSRRRGHIFPSSLVASQFEALERPDGEPGVKVVDATRPLEEVVEEIVRWLAA